MLHSIDAIILRRGNIVKHAARVSTVQRYLRQVSPLYDYQVFYWDLRDRKPRRVTAEGLLTLAEERV
jgi:hypothetical protein